MALASGVRMDQETTRRLLVIAWCLQRMTIQWRLTVRCPGILRIYTRDTFTAHIPCAHQNTSNHVKLRPSHQLLQSVSSMHFRLYRNGALTTCSVGRVIWFDIG